MSFFGNLFKKKNTQVTETQSKKTPVNNIDLATVTTDQLAKALLSEQDANTCLQALERITSEDDYLLIAGQHSVAAIRLAAAQKIQQYELLQQLLNIAKSKDKAVYRFAKDQLAEQKEAQLEKQERQQRIQYLLELAKYLNRIGYHPEFSGKLQILQQEWPQLSAEANDQIRTELAAELQAAAAILEQHTAEEAAHLAQQKAQEEAQQTQTSLIEQSQQLLTEAHAEVASQLAEKIKQITEQWDASLAAFKPDLEIGKEFERTLHSLLNISTTLERYNAQETAINEWLQESSENALEALKHAESWLKTFQWPEHVASPVWLQNFQQKINQLKEAQKEQQQDQKELISKTEQALKSLETAIKNGHVKDANKFNQQIIQGFKQLPAQSIQHLRRQQQALFAQLQEMRDWAGFATLPKKEALIEEMRNLIGSPIANNLLAEKIQSLQEEWKSLSTAGVRDHELWQQFSEAAEQAFEPCKEFFAEQAEVRKKFVEQRQTLITELDHYEQAMDWESADWPAVQKTLDTARQTFRTLGPVERHLHHKTQEKFNAVCDRIYNHLKEQYDRNLALKSELVSKAEELAASEELKGIVDRVKALQADWKAVGVTPRGPDQKLWRKFREHCDAIFSRLDEQRQERKAEINEHITQAEEIAQQALASNTEQALKEANQQLQSIELPKSVQQNLSKQLQAALNELASAAKQQELAGLFARLENLTGSDKEWSKACELPLSASFNAELFNQARAGELNGDESAQDLCLLMEITADSDSPKTDQARRMELQVQRLADGLGKGLSPADEANQLIEKWLTVKADQPLTERFIIALKKVI